MKEYGDCEGGKKRQNHGGIHQSSRVLFFGMQIGFMATFPRRVMLIGCLIYKGEKKYFGLSKIPKSIQDPEATFLFIQTVVFIGKALSVDFLTKPHNYPSLKS